MVLALKNKTNQLAQQSDGCVSKQALSVLVVDDSRTIRTSVQQLLRPHGFTVLTAGNGYEGLCIAAQQYPDIVFMDLIMPRLDGYQACSLIKRHPTIGRTPVIMLTSKSGLFDRARSLIAGSDHYIQKPIEGDTLLNAISDFARPGH